MLDATRVGAVGLLGDDPAELVPRGIQLATAHEKRREAAGRREIVRICLGGFPVISLRLLESAEHFVALRQQELPLVFRQFVRRPLKRALGRLSPAGRDLMGEEGQPGLRLVRRLLDGAFKHGLRAVSLSGAAQELSQPEQIAGIFRVL